MFLKFFCGNFRNYYRFVDFFLFFPYFRVHQIMTTSVILIIVEWEINWYPLMHTTWPEINILRIRNNYMVKVFQAKDDVTYDKHLGLSQTIKQLKMIAKTSKCWANFQRGNKFVIWRFAGELKFWKKIFFCDFAYSIMLLKICWNPVSKTHWWRHQCFG